MELNKNRKGIILSGGFGTRLYPLTRVISKQLLPIFDKPMIYYPLSNLISAGIREILIISTKDQISFYKKLLGDGNQLNITIKYKIQIKPDGIAKALLLAEDFLKGSNLVLILGDNIFFGKNIERVFAEANKSKKSSIFIKKVTKPNNYGVLVFDENNLPKKIVEKPKKLISNYAVTGIYFYENKVIEIAKKIKPSKRGELEITDVNQQLLKQEDLRVFRINSNNYWFDAGNHYDYLDACNAVRKFEKKNKTKIGSIEYESIKKKNVTKNKIKKQIFKFNSSYFIEIKKILAK